MYNYDNLHYRAKVWENIKRGAVVAVGLYLLSLLFTSCQSDTERNTQKLTDAIRERFENFAFKENRKVSLLQISDVRYTMVGQNHIDTLILMDCIQRQDKYLELFNDNIKLVKNYQEMTRLAGELGNQTMVDCYKDSAGDYLDKAAAFKDSMAYYNKQDSIVREKIKSHGIQKAEYFKTKFLCKATIGDENILDTVAMIFDKNYQFVNAKQ